MKATESAVIVRRSITERNFQETIVSMALVFGWAVHHVLDQKHHAKRIGPGFPDLTLVHPEQKRVVFVELKTEKGRLRPEQKWWGEILSACPGVEWHLWRPSDIDTAEEVLRGV